MRMPPSRYSFSQRSRGVGGIGCGRRNATGASRLQADGSILALQGGQDAEIFQRGGVALHFATGGDLLEDARLAAGTDIVLRAWSTNAGFGGADSDFPDMGRLVTADRLARARQWGLAIRLAQRLTGGVEAIVDNLDLLLDCLPGEIVASIRELSTREELAAGRDGLLEVVMDLGRRPEARLTSGDVTLLEREVTEEDLSWVISRIGDFGGDNRAGIERTLHRISAIRNRADRVVGLTCRVGRSVFGTIEILRDHIESGKSILIMGRPGVGKTTMLREAARVLASEFSKRVVVVDTSNDFSK